MKRSIKQTLDAHLFCNILISQMSYLVTGRLNPTHLCISIASFQRRVSSEAEEADGQWLPNWERLPCNDDHFAAIAWGPITEARF